MDELTEIEERLRWALRHKPAPEGFTAGVMARVASNGTLQAADPMERRAPGTLLRMYPATSWWAAAAALLLAVGGGNALHIRHQHQAQRARARAAEAQVELAMQLTNHALNEVTDNLGRSHVGQFTHLWSETKQRRQR